MIRLHTAATPNRRKISIARKISIGLGELGVDYAPEPRAPGCGLARVPTRSELPEADATGACGRVAATHRQTSRREARDGGSRVA